MPWLFIFVAVVWKSYNYSTSCKYTLVHTEGFLRFSGVTHKIKKWFQIPIPVTIYLFIQSGNAPSNCLVSHQQMKSVLLQYSQKPKTGIPTGHGEDLSSSLSCKTELGGFEFTWPRHQESILMIPLSITKLCTKLQNYRISFKTFQRRSYFI